MKSSQSSSENIVEFDKQLILQEIDQKKEYKDQYSTIKKWDEEGDEMYIMETTEGGLKYLGILNNKFQREGFCTQTYKNDDKYFGYYSEDKRNRHGLYCYRPIKNNKNLYDYEFYFGLWKNDLKDGNGVYLWMNNTNDKNLFKHFDSSNFTAYVGGFSMDKITRGVLMSKKDDDYYVYYGNYNSKLQKEGNKCFYFSSTLEEIMFGSFKEDQFKEGYIAKYDDEGLVKDLAYYDGNTYKGSELLSEEEKKHYKEMLANYRSVLMSIDYFGNLFNEFKNIYDFMNKKMNSLNIFKTDEYVEILNATSAFNKIAITKDIEKHVKY